MTEHCKTEARRMEPSTPEADKMEPRNSLEAAKLAWKFVLETLECSMALSTGRE